AKLEEANEVRIVFSEPMVVLGRIPEPVTAPFFHIAPEVPGRFRWSGTSILIFTPDAPGRLPYSTRYEVTIDGTVAAVSGRRAAKPHASSFTTPTVRRLHTGWYRRDKRYDAPVILALRFNQPVTREAAAPHLRFELAPHDFTDPVLPPEGLERLKAVDPKAMDDFAAKVARAREAASSRAVVPVSAATDWDRKAFPPGADLLVFQTDSPPPTDGWIRVTVGPDTPGLQGSATP